MILPGADFPEWVIAHYETEWQDPLMNAWAGEPVTFLAEQWVAVTMIASEVVPEPTTLVLLALGAIGLVIRRK